MTDFKDVPTDQLLSFQEFTPVHEPSFTNAQISVDNSQKQNEFLTNYPIANTNNDKDESFTDPEKEKAGLKSLWSLEYYQQLFDVNTNDVIERIWCSMVPKQQNLILNRIKVKPDLYGPIWISITLVFTIAISGNIANYFQHINSKAHWKYNFHLVSYAASAIYAYIGLIPIALWGLLKWSSEDDIEMDNTEESGSPKMLELICIYGYSLFIYIPISILWTIQVYFLQWILVIIAAVLSGLVLILTLMPSLKRSKFKIFLTIGVMLCHLLLATGFMLYFFHVPKQ